MTRDTRYAEARALQGHRAGFASRVVADVLDLGVAWLLGLAMLVAAGVVRYLLTGPPLRLRYEMSTTDARNIAVFQSLARARIGSELTNGSFTKRT